MRATLDILFYTCSCAIEQIFSFREGEFNMLTKYFIISKLLGK